MNFKKIYLTPSSFIECNHSARKHCVKWRIINIYSNGKKRVYDSGILTEKDAHFEPRPH